MEKVVLLWDPRSPWAYATSVWAQRVAAAGEIDLEWGIFSLELVNLSKDEDHHIDAQYGPGHRTAVFVRERLGKARQGEFYSTLGRLMWEPPAPEGWQEQMAAFYGQLGELNIEDVTTGVLKEHLPLAPTMLESSRAALAEIGLDPEWADQANADPATWETVIAETRHWADNKHAFGVASLVFDGGDGPMMFGPVIETVPDDATCVEIWRHMSWLVHTGIFYEAKLYRTPGPAARYVKTGSSEWRGALRSADMRIAERLISAPGSKYANVSMDWLLAKIVHDREEMLAP